MILTTRKEANPNDIGIYAAEGRLHLTETVVIPSFLYGSEAFPHYKGKEIEELEQVQHTILTGILEMPSSTPYYTLLMETGLWTMKARLSYKKLMLYHNIINSDDRRVIKKALKRQEIEDRPTTWYSSIQEEKKQYNIKLDAEKTSKSQWKDHVKKMITAEVEKTVRRKCYGMSKGRTVRNDIFETKKYISEVPFGLMKKILKYRTHMTIIPGNYKDGTDGECLLCNKEKGTTEHYFVCPETRQIAAAWEVEQQDLQSNDIGKMKNVAKFLEKVELLMDPFYKTKMYERKQNKNETENKNKLKTCKK